jgi:hypothetical protein
MSPRKSSEPEDPPPLRGLELELDRELDELLRELDPLEREPPLKDWPPPGRASKKVTLGWKAAPSPTAAPRPAIAAGAGLAMATTADRTPAKNVGGRRRCVMRAVRREAR